MSLSAIRSPVNQWLRLAEDPRQDHRCSRRCSVVLVSQRRVQLCASFPENLGICLGLLYGKVGVWSGRRRIGISGMSTSTESWRALFKREVLIIEKLLSQDFPGCHELRMQLLSARVSPIDRKGSLQFRIVGPAAPVETRVPTEAHYFDGRSDEDSGPAVHLLFHVVEGKLHELEV